MEIQNGGVQHNCYLFRLQKAIYLNIQILKLRQ